MKLIIDRFEGDFAVVELPNGKMIDCPKALLPDDAKEVKVNSRLQRSAILAVFSKASSQLGNKLRSSSSLFK